MHDKSEDSAHSCLIALIASNISLARVYVTVARSAYERGKLDQANFSHLKAEEFYHEALRWVLQMKDSERAPFLSDLLNLRTSIEWLSMKTDEGDNPSPAKREHAFMDDLLLKLLKEQS